MFTFVFNDEAHELHNVPKLSLRCIKDDTRSRFYLMTDPFEHRPVVARVVTCDVPNLLANVYARSENSADETQRTHALATIRRRAVIL